jgi:hypothetical protein
VLRLSVVVGRFQGLVLLTEVGRSGWIPVRRPARDRGTPPTGGAGSPACALGDLSRTGPDACPDGGIPSTDSACRTLAWIGAAQQVQQNGLMTNNSWDDGGTRVRVPAETRPQAVTGTCDRPQRKPR